MKVKLIFIIQKINFRFTSPTELVNYINFLDKNNEAYLDYHQWRTLYPKGISRTPYENIQFLGSDDRALCDLCRVIREKRRENSRQNYKENFIKSLDIALIFLYGTKQKRYVKRNSVGWPILYFNQSENERCRHRLDMGNKRPPANK